MRISPFVLGSLALLSLAACEPILEEDIGQDHTHVTIGWLLEDMGTDDTDMQTSRVTLLVGTTGGDTDEWVLGDYAGCGVEEMPADGPILTLKCWWAGAGDDFQVRMDGIDTLVVDHRGIDEMMPIPEFTPMKTVRILTGSEIVTTPMKKT